MRNGNYAVYEGTEYRFTMGDGDEVLLKSNDVKDASKGFSESMHRQGTYLKTVLRKELTEVYSIHTMALYEGNEYLVYSEDHDRLCLEGGESEAQMISLGFEYTEDRGVFRKWVTKDKVDRIWEEKTPL